MRITKPRYVAVFAFLSLIACSRTPPPAATTRTTAAAAGGAAEVKPQNAPALKDAPVVKEGQVFGPGTTIGNLVVYPVSSRVQVDVGPLVALDTALANGTAEVREVEGGGTVNTLVIENKGTVPVFVLAGTVVKGGNQDRQIGQDFIIDGKQTTPVDAFCVEHGRWNGQRNGNVTSGKFRSTEVVATSKVRAAAQYKKSQGEVWSNVSSANAANKKATASDTFVASVDDATLGKQRADLAAKIDAALATVKPEGELVGVAYAIDGDVRGVRFFAHHNVFQINRKKLLHGIALESLTAKAEAEARGTSVVAKPAPAPAAVETFVKSVEAERVKEARDTSAANVNEYKESAKAYGSKTMMKASPKRAAPPATPVSSDFTAK